MKDSTLVTDMEHCVYCGKAPVQRHHIFEGTANRKASDRHGFWIPLCPEHHYKIHADRNMSLFWKRRAQTIYELTHTTEQFIEEFIRSYK